MSKREFLSHETKRKVFRLLADASLARHLARNAVEHGWSDHAAYYRAENRRFLAEARSLVLIDQGQAPRTIAECLDLPHVSIQASMRDRRHAPVQVSKAPAFRRLSLLCVLVQAGKGRVAHQPLQCLPRLRAPWAPVSGQWPLVLPAPFRLRAVQSQAPTLAQLDRCAQYRRADSVCAYPRTLRIAGMN